MFDEKSMDTYSNNHLPRNFQFCPMYLRLKILYLVHIAVTLFHLYFTDVIS